MMKCATSAPRGPSLRRWMTSSGAKLPTAKTMVENRTNQGTRPAKIELGVNRRRSAPSNPPTKLRMKKPVTLTSGDAQDAAAIRPDAGERPRKQGGDARSIGSDRVEPGEQERWKRHQAPAAGERVEGAAQKGGGGQGDDGDQGSGTLLGLTSGYHTARPGRV